MLILGNIKVKINGADAVLQEGLNLDDLVKIRALKGFFAIEKNLKIMNKEDYTATFIEDGDEIEIVGFAGGG